MFGTFTVAFDATFTRLGPGNTPEIRAWFFLMNMGFASTVVFLFGIHSGPLVAGVIGQTKFQYDDVWGDTVNTASRMESHGEVGRVHVSAATHALIASEFTCVPRGAIAVKGQGEMETYFVEGRDAPP